VDEFMVRMIVEMGGGPLDSGELHVIASCLEMQRLPDSQFSITPPPPVRN
jgi:hypothetical protein